VGLLNLKLLEIGGGEGHLGSSTISGFAISSGGALTPLPGTVVATLPGGSINLDIAISSDGKYLYTLNSGIGTISILGIDQDGTLINLGDLSGLSAAAGFNGTLLLRAY
jgi:6-phosphogluconolactonase